MSVLISLDEICYERPTLKVGANFAAVRTSVKQTGTSHRNVYSLSDCALIQLFHNIAGKFKDNGTTDEFIVYQTVVFQIFHAPLVGLDALIVEDLPTWHRGVSLATHFVDT
jgi:hypothetical protein